MLGGRIGTQTRRRCDKMMWWTLRRGGRHSNGSREEEGRQVVHRLSMMSFVEMEMRVMERPKMINCVHQYQYCKLESQVEKKSWHQTCIELPLLQLSAQKVLTSPCCFYSFSLTPTLMSTTAVTDERSQDRISPYYPRLLVERDRRMSRFSFRHLEKLTSRVPLS